MLIESCSMAAIFDGGVVLGMFSGYIMDGVRDELIKVVNSRRRFSNNYRILHREQSDRQAYPSPRYNLVLSVSFLSDLQLNNRLGTATDYWCSSGSAADTQAIADIVHYHLQMYK